MTVVSLLSDSLHAFPRPAPDRNAATKAAVILSLLTVALLTRARGFGDPAIHVDEQFYLLVADRMWHGALPYVDIWDRKPILLFLIYAALRPLSPDGVVAYQIGATLFAVATAFVIVLIAQRFTNLRGAWLAGVAYLLYLPALNGAGGQSPVFYNLFLVLAALEVIHAEEAHSQKDILRRGLLCMFWSGLAIQVKYTAVFEGASFGVWLLILLMRRNCGSPPRIIAYAGFWIVVALAPTILALAFYVLTGHGEAFVQANFLSIFQKHQPPNFWRADLLWMSAVELAPLLFVAAFSFPLLLRDNKGSATVYFLLLWTLFGTADFFCLGIYYAHYALPVSVPLVIICGPLLGTKIGGLAAMALFGWVALTATEVLSTNLRQFHKGRVAALVEAARPYVAHGCLYLHDGPSVVYLLTHSCLPTRYPFPGHLNEEAEAQATDATRSMAELLATRPSAIFVMAKPIQPPNLATRAMLDAVLARDYQRIGTLPDVAPSRQQIIYARKDLLPRQ
jgi:hypothetical protein